MVLKFTSITLNTPHLEDMLQFYRILGVNFKEAKVDKGTCVCRALIGGCEFSLYASTSLEARKTPLLQMSFEIDDLENKFSEICQIGKVTAMMTPTEMPDGLKAIVLDPDGNSVELKSI